jgi:hypothetical protein
MRTRRTVLSLAAVLILAAALSAGAANAAPKKLTLERGVGKAPETPFALNTEIYLDEEYADEGKNPALIELGGGTVKCYSQALEGKLRVDGEKKDKIELEHAYGEINGSSFCEGGFAALGTTGAFVETYSAAPPLANLFLSSNKKAEIVSESKSNPIEIFMEFEKGFCYYEATKLKGTWSAELLTIFGEEFEDMLTVKFAKQKIKLDKTKVNSGLCPKTAMVTLPFVFSESGEPEPTWFVRAVLA